MRIALITLALVALAFIGSIVYSISSKEGISFLSRTSTTTKTVPDTPIEIETLKYQIKTEEKLNELTKKVEALAGGTTSVNLPQADDTNSSSSTGEVLIPISGKFLAKVMPTYEFTKTQKNGIYDLHLFDLSMQYTTYLDPKSAIKVTAIATKYDNFLKNMKAIDDSVYTVNETKSFGVRSFYVNPAKNDTLVRIVFEFENQVLALEVPKTKFTTLKNLLLKK